MLMVGNVIVNRALANCYTFKNIRNIEDIIRQSPGGFSGINSSLYIGTATKKEKSLAKRCLKGEYYYPATHALWFYAPGSNNKCKKTWYEQSYAGRYKNHCFYKPDKGVCSQIY